MEMELMLQFHYIKYAATEEAAQEAMKAAITSEEDEKYETYRNHLTGLWNRRALWCRLPAMRGHHTNNYAEVTVPLQGQSPQSL